MGLINYQLSALQFLFLMLAWQSSPDFFELVICSSINSWGWSWGHIEQMFIPVYFILQTPNPLLVLELELFQTGPMYALFFTFLVFH